MRTITGAVRCTRTDWLPVLSKIALQTSAERWQHLEQFSGHEVSLNYLYSPILTFTLDHNWNRDVRYGLTSRMRQQPSNTSGAHGSRIKSLISQISHWLMTLPSSYREWTCPVTNGACQTGSDQTRYHAATACMNGVTSPRHSATAVNTKQ